MKKLIAILLLVMMIISLFCGCGYEADIIGMWKTNSYLEYNRDCVGVIIFKSNGTYEMYVCEEDDLVKEDYDVDDILSFVEKEKGKYKINDGIIEFCQKDGTIFHYEYEENKIINKDTTEEYVYYKMQD